jgi:hypothetical protein
MKKVLTTKARRHKEDFMVSNLNLNGLVCSYRLNIFCLFNFVPLCLRGDIFIVSVVGR